MKYFAVHNHLEFLQLLQISHLHIIVIFLFLSLSEKGWQSCSAGVWENLLPRVAGATGKKIKHNTIEAHIVKNASPNCQIFLSSTAVGFLHVYVIVLSDTWWYRAWWWRFWIYWAQLKAPFIFLEKCMCWELIVLYLIKIFFCTLESSICILWHSHTILVNFVLYLINLPIMWTPMKLKKKFSKAPQGGSAW